MMVKKKKNTMPLKNLMRCVGDIYKTRLFVCSFLVKDTIGRVMGSPGCVYLLCVCCCCVGLLCSSCFESTQPHNDPQPFPLCALMSDRTFSFTLPLLFTFSVVCVFTFSSVVKEAVQNNLWAYLSSFIVFIVVAFTLSCCRSFSRRHPWNLVGLVGIFLSNLSYMVGTVASFHNTTAVVITMAVTFLGVLLFCFQTRYDFTIYYGVLLIMAVDVIMFGVICTFYYSHVASIIYGCLGALLYSLFLLVDCQLMMGKMSYRLNPEEYVNAALTIYLDIILIFLYLLGRR
uniref:Si:ch211-284o19.8 n=1 Tax=Poecilia reticulata TaxID=8081 RepID=A0A3P9MY18_POERE